MEKYRKFADDATGNHPFLPHPSLKPTSADKKVAYSVGLLLSLIKLVLLSILGPVYGILASLGSIPGLGVLKAIANGMTAKVILMIFGFTDAKVMADSTDTAQGLAKRDERKQLILVNSSSPFDSLVISHLLAGEVYRFDINSSVRPGLPGRLLVSQIELGFFFKSLDWLIPKEISTVTSKQKTIAEHFANNTHLYLMYEGLKTNNHGVLSLSEDLVSEIQVLNSKEKLSVTVATIDYSNKGGVVHPSNTVSPVLLHLFKSLLTPAASVKVHISKMSASSLTLKSSIIPQFNILISKHGGKYSIRKASSEYRQFLTYWQQTQKSGYDKDK